MFNHRGKLRDAVNDQRLEIMLLRGQSLYGVKHVLGGGGQRKQMHVLVALKALRAILRPDDDRLWKHRSQRCFAGAAFSKQRHDDRTLPAGRCQL